VSQSASWPLNQCRPARDLYLTFCQHCGSSFERAQFPLIWRGLPKPCEYLMAHSLDLWVERLAHDGKSIEQ